VFFGIVRFPLAKLGMLRGEILPVFFGIVRFPLAMLGTLRGDILPLFFWILLGFVIFGLAVWAYQARSDQQQWAQLLERIGQEPGLVVTSVQEQGSKSIFYGLRDPLATNPEQILSEFGYTSQQAVFRLNPFMDLTPEFMHKRAMKQLSPPPSVIVSWEDTTLVLAGEASHAWIQQTQFLGPLIPGVTHIQMGQLVDTDMKQFETLKRRLEKNAITFGAREFRIRPGQRAVLTDIAQTILALDQAASVLGISPRIHIQGFTSPDGGAGVNKNLRVLRAQAVLSELKNDSLRAVSLMADGSGSAGLPTLSSSDKAVSQGRFVSFRVVMAPDRVPESRQ